MSQACLKEDTMNMDADKREAMINKITALLSKAENKGCTPEESEAFYAKAQELMTKWAIDEELLRMSGKLVDDVIKTIRVDVASTYFMAMITLWSAVGRANDCVVMYSKGYGSAAGKAVVTGFESDLARVQLLVTSLQLFAMREAKRESKVQGGDYYFRRSFIESFAHRIGARLREQRDLNVNEAVNTTHNNNLLPALVDKRKQVNDFVNNTMRPGKGRSGRGTKYDAAGGAAGTRAANRADIGNTRIGSSRGKLGR
jgi:hypothetical protein